MSDFIALDWEKDRICGIEAQVSKGLVQVKSFLQFAWPEGIDPMARPQEAGERLKSQLQRAGIGSNQVLVSLPREDVVVRHLELPNAPDAELPDLVRFQAASKSSLPLDRLVLDYLPLPSREAGAGRDVLMTTIATNTVANVRAVLTAAGLELESLGVSSVAAGEIIARAEANLKPRMNGPSLVVTRDRDRVEISVLHGHWLLFMHGTRVTGGNGSRNEQAVLAEINRSLVAFDRLKHGVTNDHVWVLGGEEDEGVESLLAALRERFGEEVRLLDPLGVVGVALPRAGIPAPRALYAGPLEMLLAQSDRLVESIDFLNPRKPVVRMDRTKLKLGVAAAGIVLFLGLGYGGRQLHINSLDNRISTLQDDANKLDVAVKDGEPLLKSAKEMGKWTDASVNWLDEMHELIAATPGTRNIYMADWNFEKPVSTGTAVAKITSQLRAQDREQAQDLRQNIVDMGNYKVYPARDDRLLPSSSEYSWSFKLEADILSKPKPVPPAHREGTSAPATDENQSDAGSRAGAAGSTGRT